jgi:NAD+ diphosphatase
VLSCEVRQESEFGLKSGARGGSTRRAHHPVLSRRVDDDDHVEVDVGVRTPEDVVHVESGDRGRRESGEGQRRVGHDLTVEPNGGWAPRAAARGGYGEGMHERWPLTEAPLIDRAAHLRSSTDLDACDAVVVVGGTVLADNGRLAIVPAAARPPARFAFYLGRVGGRDVAGIVPEGEPGALPSAAMVPLRGAFVDLDDEVARADRELATAAVAMATWHERAVHCPLCGTATEPREGGWSRRCPADGVSHYPRTDPAVIVAITDADDRILLAHVSYHAPLRYSHLAGYVEPGESLEQAARREVFEESGITLAELEYAGSQPWPFPASIMIGFRARAASTDIVVDGVEVTDAAWLSRSELARLVAAGDMILAPPGSIARHLIHSWYGGPVSDADGVSSA